MAVDVNGVEDMSDSLDIYDQFVEFNLQVLPEMIEC
jgi:hypothetical protein